MSNLATNMCVRPASPRQIREELVRRCIAAGLDAWSWDDGGRMEQENGPLTHGAASVAHGGSITGVREGQWMVSVAAPATAEACTAGVGLIVHGDRAAAERALAFVRHMSADLTSSASDRRAIVGFSDHLSEMYEEIGLLYRLGRSMNQVAAPSDFIIHACEDLHRTLAFSWVAARFCPQEPGLVGLAGDLILAGELPCDEAAFDDAAIRAIKHVPSDRWMLLTPRSGAELSSLVGSEVLAHPISRNDHVVGVLLAGNKSGNDPDVSSFDTQLLDAVADCIRVFVDNAALYSDQRSLFFGTIEALAASIDAKDSYTNGHSQRVAHLAWKLAIAAGLDDEAAERVRISGLLHDVGKIGVPEAILCKPGKLEDHEFEQIKQHPGIGARILKDIPFLSDIIPGVLYHHERLDGRGYPEGLSGDDVPMIARILCIADSFDAMSSNRSYRSAMSRERVLTELRNSAGKQFDPELVEHFIRLDLGEYDRMVAEHRGQTRIAA